MNTICKTEVVLFPPSNIHILFMSAYVRLQNIHVSAVLEYLQ